MKKIISFIVFLCLLIIPCEAKTIDKVISQSNLGLRSALALYIINSDTNKVIYKKNEQKLLNPASTLKLITFSTSYKVLGPDYLFKTALYKSGNDLYLKLGGDALLTSKDLEDLFKDAKTKVDFNQINNIYIDDSIMNKYLPYPSGWMQDDIWPHSRMITPYIIDNNKVKIAIQRSSLATKVDIVQNDEYKLPIINDLTLSLDESKIQDIKIEKMYGEDSSIIKFSGTANKDEMFDLPVLKPEINFNIKLRNALEKNKIVFMKKINAKSMPQNAQEIAFVSHSIDEIGKKILLNSDTFGAETVFRIAAAKHINYKHPATMQDAIDMFYEINAPYKEEDIKVTDGSGVSRYNLISAKVAVEIFNKLNKETDVSKIMATPGSGTLKNRMLFLEGNLRAKTGTLSNMSALLGTLKTKKGRQIIFCTIIQNSPKRKAILKNFENDLITTIYRRY